MNRHTLLILAAGGAMLIANSELRVMAQPTIGKTKSTAATLMERSQVAQDSPHRSVFVTSLLPANP